MLEVTTVLDTAGLEVMDEKSEVCKEDVSIFKLEKKDKRDSPGGWKWIHCLSSTVGFIILVIIAGVSKGLKDWIAVRHRYVTATEPP